VYALLVLIAPAALSVLTVLKSVVKAPSMPAILFVAFVTLGVLLEASGVLPPVVSRDEARDAQQFFGTSAEVIAALAIALVVERRFMPGSNELDDPEATEVRSRVGTFGAAGIVMSVVAALLALLPGWPGELAINIALVLVLGGILAAATAILVLARPDRNLALAESHGHDGSTLALIRELLTDANQKSDDPPDEKPGAVRAAA
jgi:hypothetical protein